MVVKFSLLGAPLLQSAGSLSALSGRRLRWNAMPAFELRLCLRGGDILALPGTLASRNGKPLASEVGSSGGGGGVVRVGINPDETYINTSKRFHLMMSSTSPYPASLHEPV